MQNKHRVLIIFAHPAYQKSRVNRALAQQVRTLDGVLFHDLYEAYPEFDIDIHHEQRLLESSDIVVFQHPLFWYSTPAIIKEWLDLVYEHGWAYGSRGTALRGKSAMHAITTGGGKHAYGEHGLNRYSLAEFLKPLEQTARLCGMQFLPPFIVYGAHKLQVETIEQQAAAYGRVIQALRDGRRDSTRDETSTDCV